ncbi:phosphatidylserine synthase [Tistrella mobilis]|uniref:Phosphatidylserine/phosphatidylglycerophosphate/ cardiolipin synthase-like protein n=1 Tax=Tistrella mobilis (strain KA081020-065) TaxID=1110502 RepID=I3TMM5_TISMK|nr:phosphatidylserine synthase [Tistrella mobilis]AFK54013.1 phosphatidylserine/phosphatidylglycerophosphate/cardiolipin synthase-like protein [Tistrella mobilis KA081020-065]
MSVLIAIPVFRVACKVGIDRGRAWSVIDELVLWAITRQSKSIAALAAAADLPPQIIVASIARLMRFRLVEVTVGEGTVAFRASPFGFKSVSSGNPLPFYPKRISRRVSFVIEWATGDFFPTRQIRLMTPYRLEEARRAGTEVRVVSVEGGGPSMSHDANLNRLSDIAARGWDEQVALVDGRTAIMRDDEFMVLRVIDGIPQGLPETAGPSLRGLVAEAAALPRGTTEVPVTYAGPKEIFDPQPVVHRCNFDDANLIIGGSAQGRCLERLLADAHRRVVIHSTFLDAARFSVLSGPIKAACARGVSFDLLWGAEKDEETERRNAAQASQIARVVGEDRDLRGRFKVHMRSTGSHAKLILLDTAEDGWIAGVGSCNWLSSPFQAVELTVLLRDQRAVADVAVALQNMVGRRGLADTIATEMYITARDLRRVPSPGGSAEVSLVVGDAHDQLIRAASGAASERFVVGSNLLGSTARPGALMQGEVAAGREGVRATVVYTKPTGPLKNRHARVLAEEARSNGLALVRTRKIPLHGKFVAWDKDDLVVTSLNWASAAADPDFPWGDIGVHVRARGLATEALRKLEAIFPEMTVDPLAAESA